MKRPVLIVLVVLATAVVAGSVGAWVGRSHPGGASAQASQRYQCPMHPGVVQDHPGECPICGMKLVKVDAVAPKTAERKLLYYRSPMDPKQTSPVPAKDSMGMDFVPVYSDEIAAPSPVEGLASVDVDPSQQQLIGLRTAEVDRGEVGAAIRTVGRVSVDETQVRRVSVKVGGYVDHVYADFVGKAVKKGQPLFSFYSPEIFAAETELASVRGAGGPLSAAARRKLELWDVPAPELARLERDGTASKTVTLVSPAAGVITKKEIVEGARLEAGAMPYEIVDLSTVWVLADVYESELRYVAPGVDATLKLNAFPGRSWTGKVLFVDPLLDPKTRTAKVRLAFANASGELKPELYGQVTLERPPRQVLRVPYDALVRGGDRDVVFVARGEGRFEPKVVNVGEVSRDYAEVLEGLSEGDRVVTRANFLIDSESRLRASMQRLQEQTGSAPVGALR